MPKLTHRKEKFVPIEEGKVSFYTCGPTVYDFSHIGNFRTFLFEDLLKRVLLAFDYKVHHVMNITDVDDKTIKKANEDNIKDQYLHIIIYLIIKVLIIFYFKIHFE